MKNLTYFMIFTSIIHHCRSSENISTSNACDSEIYCYGDILKAIQMSKIYNDSKIFVDMKTNCSIDYIHLFINKTNWNKEINNTKLKGLMDECFYKEGSEFEKWNLTDWTETPKFANSIKDEGLKNWTIALNRIWNDLGRKVIDDVRLNPTNYSLIYVPNPFIIPGGRFREVYYWDSYWIIRGLLLCEMHNTSKGMITNYLSMIKTFGHVPNGGRVYYAKRSQPPMIIPMMKSYLDATNDTQFVIENIHELETEFQYWTTNHNVTINKNGKNYTLAVYRDSSTGPRPESYREDYFAAQHFKTEIEKENFYSEIKAAAESGWDFSSRWFILNGTNEGDLLNTKTRSIIPVDLNALVYWNAKILSDFHQAIMKNTDKAKEYEYIATQWKEAVTQILWDEDVGSWLDYDTMNNIKRNYFYPTNISPLWTGCFDKSKINYFVPRVLKYLNKTEILGTEGGIPTTLRNSKQQWDHPNAWAPLQYIMVMALESTDDIDAKIMASNIASKWMCTNYVPYYKNKKMYEKYRVDLPGQQGNDSGEYPLQDGFGWSNGVILEFLNMYKNTASIRNWNKTAPSCYNELIKEIEKKKNEVHN